MQNVEKRFKSRDETELVYRHWKPKKKSGRAIVLFHRGHEHSARWQDVVEKLGFEDMHIFAWDARGHGHSPGERGYAQSFGTLIKDVDDFIRHLSTEYEIATQDMIIFAHSVGSVLVSTWVHDYAPDIRGLVLGSPALKVRLYAPLAIPALRLLNKIKPKSFIKSYVKGRLLTRDPEKAASYNTDPLITPQIAVNILLGLRDAGDRLIADAGAITVPTLILTSGDDFVVDQGAQKKFYDGLSHPRKEMQTFKEFRHDTFNELDNHLPIDKARMFIEDLFERSEEPAFLLKAHEKGYSKKEHDRLSAPLPWYSPKKWSFAAARLGLTTFGRLSEGIRVGWKTGFDSGSMLDYVYENKARGTSPLGRLIDRMYLDSPGWKGIRKRKTNLESFLHQEIHSRIERDEKVRLVDIATGHGRYVLDVIKEYDHEKIEAELRDYSEINVTAGNKLAEEMMLENVSYKLGNAFDKDSLSEIDGTPNVAIISGLYELFSDNSMISESLEGLYEKLAPGASLIYTNQPWHPQLEFIARVLTSHRDGDAWVMRLRTQQEMDQLIAAAGFEKMDQKIDEEGIFSVSLARKPLEEKS
ncbi:MAG: bifunctional alpha/beta hydrolase/class I SAM-dependent methyltransferase [Sneathiellales bacterium]|nr:bifunctional alpha/beta hydrolase/class I SAM-dependent methyltransferase [Sneathiellales bacterium]